MLGLTAARTLPLDAEQSHAHKQPRQQHEPPASASSSRRASGLALSTTSFDLSILQLLALVKNTLDPPPQSLAAVDTTALDVWVCRVPTPPLETLPAGGVSFVYARDKHSTFITRDFAADARLIAFFSESASGDAVLVSVREPKNSTMSVICGSTTTTSNNWATLHIYKRELFLSSFFDCTLATVLARKLEMYSHVFFDMYAHIRIGNERLFARLADVYGHRIMSFSDDDFEQQVSAAVTRLMDECNALFNELTRTRPFMNSTVKAITPIHKQLEKKYASFMALVDSAARKVEDSRWFRDRELRKLARVPVPVVNKDDEEDLESEMQNLEALWEDALQTLNPDGPYKSLVRWMWFFKKLATRIDTGFDITSYATMELEKSHDDHEFFSQINRVHDMIRRKSNDCDVRWHEINASIHALRRFQFAKPPQLAPGCAARTFHVDYTSWRNPQFAKMLSRDLPTTLGVPAALAAAQTVNNSSKLKLADLALRLQRMEDRLGRAFAKFKTAFFDADSAEVSANFNQFGFTYFLEKKIDEYSAMYKALAAGIEAMENHLERGNLVPVYKFLFDFYTRKPVVMRRQRSNDSIVRAGFEAEWKSILSNVYFDTEFDFDTVFVELQPHLVLFRSVEHLWRRAEDLVASGGCASDAHILRIKIMEDVPEFGDDNQGKIAQAVSSMLALSPPAQGQELALAYFVETNARVLDTIADVQLQTRQQFDDMLPQLKMEAQELVKLERLHTLHHDFISVAEQLEHRLSFFTKFQQLDDLATVAFTNSGKIARMMAAIAAFPIKRLRGTCASSRIPLYERFITETAAKLASLDTAVRVAELLSIPETMTVNLLQVLSHDKYGSTLQEHARQLQRLETASHDFSAVTPDDFFYASLAALARFLASREYTRYRTQTVQSLAKLVKFRDYKHVIKSLLAQLNADMDAFEAVLDEQHPYSLTLAQLNGMWQRIAAYETDMRDFEYMVKYFPESGFVLRRKAEIKQRIDQLLSQGAIATAPVQYPHYQHSTSF